MATHRYEAASDVVTIWHHEGEDAWPSVLLGMAAAPVGPTPLPPQARGPLALRTDGAAGPAALRLEAASFEPEAVTLTWRAEGQPLVVTSVWTLHADTCIWRRRDTLRNVGGAPVAVSSCLARFAFAPGAYDVYTQGSWWSAENQGFRQPLRHGRVSAQCEGGRTTQGGTPYLALCDATNRRGIAFHVLPRGNWTARATQVTYGSDATSLAVVEAGLATDDLRLELAPGGALVLPEVFLQALPEGEPHLAAAAWHDCALTHVLPASKAPPVVYNTWFDAFDDLNVARLRQQLAVAREVGCEAFVIDAGWYGRGSGLWAAQTGDWREKVDAAFRGEMAAFADEVRAAGLGFGLWVEPERIGPQAPILREHPEWFLPATPPYHRPDLTQPAAYDYILGELRRLIEAYRLAWMKVDFNLNLGIDASGAEFSAYYAAWYHLLDELRAAHPEVFLEGCASGGMRSDLNTLSHFDGHFLTDTVAPVDVVRILQGALLRLPAGRLTLWAVLRSVGATIPRYGAPIAETPARVVAPGGGNWERSMATDVDFAARVCLPGILGISGSLAELDSNARERLRWHIAFYRQHRGFLANARTELLTPPQPLGDRDGWAALQLHAPEAPSHLLLAYRLGHAPARWRVYPRGLEQQRLYRVVNVDDEASARYALGRTLMAEGIEVELPAAHSAAMIWLHA